MTRERRGDTKKGVVGGWKTDEKRMKEGEEDEVKVEKGKETRRLSED